MSESPSESVSANAPAAKKRSASSDKRGFFGRIALFVRQVIAEREGPIVPLVGEVIYPAAYAHERAVCVDTTAAGGNASLLAAA